MLKIEGPICVFECCSDIEFTITSLVNDAEVRIKIKYQTCLNYYLRLVKLPNNGLALVEKCSLILTILVLLSQLI